MEHSKYIVIGALCFGILGVALSVYNLISMSRFYSQTAPHAPASAAQENAVKAAQNRVNAEASAKIIIGTVASVSGNRVTLNVQDGTLPFISHVPAVVVNAQTKLYMQSTTMRDKATYEQELSAYNARVQPLLSSSTLVFIPPSPFVLTAINLSDIKPGMTADAYSDPSSLAPDESSITAIEIVVQPSQ